MNELPRPHSHRPFGQPVSNIANWPRTVSAASLASQGDRSNNGCFPRRRESCATLIPSLARRNNREEVT